MSAQTGGLRVTRRPPRRGLAVVLLVWRAAWGWGLPAVFLWLYGPLLAALMLASTFAASMVIDRMRPEPLGEYVKRELGT